MHKLAGLFSAPLLVAAAPLASTPDLGKAEGRCRPGESGPAIMLAIHGLKDRQGRLRAEIYPSNDQDFLVDDNILVAQGKTFRRVEIDVPATAVAKLCIRVPAAGVYSMAILHDRDANRKFNLSTDGAGFPGNPKLGLSRPTAAATRIVAGNGITHANIVMNYRRGLLRFAPLDKPARP